ncbi:MAG: phosphoenolpyruvate carboxylase [Thermoleophilia bacterium]
MATQHPDSAGRYIAIQEEPAEAVAALTRPPVGLGIDEVMVDFEGKMTPYHQTNEIAQGLLDRGLVPGRDVWITPRISSATEETAFRQLMALMSVIEATYQASQREPEAHIAEVIIPMVRSARDLVKVRDRIRDVIYLGHKEFRLPYDPDALQLIPLVEEAPELLSVGDLLRAYVQDCAGEGFSVGRLRVMVGRSDTALSYGHLASALAAGVGVAQICAVADELGLEAAPILGAGYLPFRGGVRLDSIDTLLADYPGVRTVTIQSGIRYDTEEAAAAVAKLHDRLDARGPCPPRLPPEDQVFLADCVGVATIPYLRTFERLLDLVVPLSDLIPARRDRLARKGPAGYARAAAEPEALIPLVGHEGVRQELASIRPACSRSLPRAISFTGALYSIGLPPEFLGTGRALARVRALFGSDGLERMLAHYRALGVDLAWAERFLNLQTAAALLPPEALAEVRTDVELCREIVGYEPLPRDDGYHLLLETIQPMLRALLTGTVAAADRELVTGWLCRLGTLRGSLG